MISAPDHGISSRSYGLFGPGIPGTLPTVRHTLARHYQVTVKIGRMSFRSLVRFDVYAGKRRVLGVEPRGFEPPTSAAKADYPYTTLSHYVSLPCLLMRFRPVRESFVSYCIPSHTGPVAVRLQYDGHSGRFPRGAPSCARSGARLVSVSRCYRRRRKPDLVGRPQVTKLVGACVPHATEEQ